MTKEVGNFALGNTEYRVFKAEKGFYKHCYYTHSRKNSIEHGFCNFSSNPKIFDLSDDEITNYCIKWIMEIESYLLRHKLK